MTTGDGGSHQARYRLFRQPWFWLLIAHAVLSQMATLLLRVNSSYRAIEINLDPAWLGVFTVAFSLFPLVLGVRAGRATDRHGEKPTLIVGAGAVLLSAVGFIFLGDTVIGLLACNMVLGLGHILGMLGEQSIASKNGPSEQRDRIFGYYTVFISLGQVLSPLFIGLVGGNTVIPATGPVFLWAASLATLSFLLCLVMRSSDRPATPSESAGNGSILSLMRLPTMPAAMLASVTVLTSMDLIMVYLPAIGAERHIEAATISALLSLRAATSMLSRISYHALIASLGRPRVVVLSITLAAVTVAALAIDMPVWAMAVTIAIAGYALGLCLPLTLAWMTEISPFDVRSTVISLRLAGNRLGQTLIPSCAALVAAGVGIAGVFWSSGAALGIVAFTSALAFRKARPPKS